jgi:hypothetical protein
MVYEYYQAGAAVVFGIAVVAAAVKMSGGGVWRYLPTSTAPEFTRPNQAAAYALAMASRETRSNGSKRVPPFDPCVVGRAKAICKSAAGPFASQAVTAIDHAAKDFAATEARRKQAFDDVPQEGEKLLESLWEAAGLQGAPSRRAEQWAKLGFQGLDPSTDLRGGGLLSLEQIVFLARAEPWFLKEMMAYNEETLANGDMAWFLTAVVSIQFTTRVVLGEVQLKQAHYEFLLDDGASIGRGLARLNVALLHHFFSVWREKQPSVMEFTQFVDPNVLDTFFSDAWSAPREKAM